MVSVVSTFIAVVIASFANPTASQVPDLIEGQYWKPPLEETSGFTGTTKPFRRSPCPALNTLCNCGHLKRNGQDITKEEIRHAIQTQFGHDDEVVDLLLLGLPDKLSLNDLSSMGHPISLSRRPEYTGVDPAIVDLDLVKDLTSRAKNGFLSAESVGHTYKARREMFQKDPRFQLTPEQARQAYGQGSGAVLVFGSKMNNNTVSVSVINDFFIDEKFPAGWKRASVIRLDESRKMTDEIQAAAQ
ncbi:putative chloroperoxidase [Plasmopara halstedii]